MALPSHLTIDGIGSEEGTLQAWFREDGSVTVRRGCFTDDAGEGGDYGKPLAEFEAAVERSYNPNNYAHWLPEDRKIKDAHGRVYRSLIKFLKEMAVDRAHHIDPIVVSDVCQCPWHLAPRTTYECCETCTKFAEERTRELAEAGTS